MWPVGMARHLRLLPGRQALIEIGQAFRRLFFERLHFIAGRDGRIGIGDGLELRDLSFQLGEGGFKIEIGVH